MHEEPKQHGLIGNQNARKSGPKKDSKPYNFSVPAAILPALRDALKDVSRRDKESPCTASATVLRYLLEGFERDSYVLPDELREGLETATAGSPKPAKNEPEKAK